MNDDGSSQFDQPLADPREELGALVEALGAHVARQRRLGVRRTALGAPAPGELAGETGTRPNADDGSGAPRPSELAVESPGAPRPVYRSPGRTPIAAPRPAAASAPRPAELAARQPLPQAAASPAPRSSATPAHLQEAAARAAENRALAAACSDLGTLREAVAACTACDLCKTRQQTVFSDGDGSAGVLFVGEAPGADEDASGVPFVGAAGGLLTDIIEKGMRLPRSKVVIANVLKCCPPGNRDPTDAEKLLCTPFLDRQIELLAPRVVVALGRHAANHLLGYAGAARLSMRALRGKVFERQGRKVVATYHPSYLLRTPEDKRECWKDIQLAMRELGIAPPGPATPSRADRASEPGARS